MVDVVSPPNWWLCQRSSVETQSNHTNIIHALASGKQYFLIGN